ncbi:MAG: PAS domain S-box protein, partial [Pseudomonadota bacterium]
MSVNNSPVADADDRTLLSSIIETAPDAIITIDASGEILSFSPAAEKVFGYEQGEIIGHNVSQLEPPPVSWSTVMFRKTEDQRWRTSER